MEKRLIDYDDLSLSDKIDHIWEYYKFHIIATLCALLFVGWLLNHYIINPPPKVGFDITLFGNYADSDRLVELKTQLDAFIIEEDVNEETNVEFLSTSEDLDPNMLQVTVTKMMGKASLQEYDIMIFEGESYLMFTDEDVLMPVEDAVALPSKLISEERLVSGESLGMGTDTIYLIDVSDKAFFRTVYGSDEPIYLGIYSGSKHLDKIEKGLDYLLNTLE